MGPIHDELATEQGSVSSGDFYKSYGKSQLHMAQTSSLGVELCGDLVVSGLGQADDTLLVSNSLHSLQNLLQLSLYYRSKYNVELCPEKTKLQVIATKNISSEVGKLFWSGNFFGSGKNFLSGKFLGSRNPKIPKD